MKNMLIKTNELGVINAPITKENCKTVIVRLPDVKQIASMTLDDLYALASRLHLSQSQACSLISHP